MTIPLIAVIIAALVCLGRQSTPAARAGGQLRDAELVTEPYRRPEPESGGMAARGEATGSAADDAPEWDEWYASSAQLWSGQPNAALVTEVAGLRPGRALDVGCGEGADAVWLAGQGWTVTALDVSQVALERAALHARQAAVRVHWLHGSFVGTPLPAAGFDLVSAQYPALRRTPANEAERSLLAAVAPGGTLLVVHHADMDVEQAGENGFDPADYVSPFDVAPLLGDDWDVAFDERRPAT